MIIIFLYIRLQQKTIFYIRNAVFCYKVLTQNKIE
jgi:hypothetical protein